MRSIFIYCVIERAAFFFSSRRYGYSFLEYAWFLKSLLKSHLKKLQVKVGEGRYDDKFLSLLKQEVTKKYQVYF